MGLTQGEKATIEKVRTGGAADLAVRLDDDVCACLLSVVASDLALKIKDLPQAPAAFFSPEPERLRLPGVDFASFIARAVDENREVLTYFTCLAKLHKARLKYGQILAHQAIPTMDQVGPRGLLQFGTMTSRALTGFLLWRKWMYDIDNRAAQETGYVFEPIIAHSIGGVPWAARNSPIRRREDGAKGRQVDCVVEKRAYEFKLRVTTAASGQGRWKEELSFPTDCIASGYKPVMIVFDPTPNAKLTELERAFRSVGGEAYVGDAAWHHLETEAGPTMGRFLEKYVREPINALLNEAPSDNLPPKLSLSMTASLLTVRLGNELVRLPRGEPSTPDEPDSIPDDVNDDFLGP